MEKYRKFSFFIILIPTPDFPPFYYMLGGNLESLLYGDVSVMPVFLSIQRSWNGGQVRLTVIRGTPQQHNRTSTTRNTCQEVPSSVPGVLTPSNLNTAVKHILRERLHTHKIFTKDQCFYLNYHGFSIKSYVLDVN